MIFCRVFGLVLLLLHVSSVVVEVARTLVMQLLLVVAFLEPCPIIEFVPLLITLDPVQTMMTMTA